MTKQNQLIYQIIRDNHTHLTAAQVFEQAMQAMPHISLATVYRNLGKLAEQKRIRRINVPDGPDLYDWQTSDHGHLICAQCGCVRDLPPVDIAQIEAHYGVKVIGYELNLTTLCENCDPQSVDLNHNN